MTTRNLPMLNLDRIVIDSPCSEDWNGMAGEGRVRFCGSCEKNVFDLSSLTREDAEALLAANGATPCVRLYRRADGTVVTGLCVELKPRAALGTRCMKAIAAVTMSLSFVACAAPETAESTPLPTGATAALAKSHEVLAKSTPALDIEATPCPETVAPHRLLAGGPRAVAPPTTTVRLQGKPSRPSPGDQF